MNGRKENKSYIIIYMQMNVKLHLEIVVKGEICKGIEYFKIANFEKNGVLAELVDHFNMCSPEPEKSIVFLKVRN